MRAREIIEDAEEHDWVWETLDHLEDSGWKRIDRNTVGTGVLRLLVTGDLIAGWCDGSRKRISVSPGAQPQRTVELMVHLTEAVAALRRLGFVEIWYEQDMAIGDLVMYKTLSRGRDRLYMYFTPDIGYDGDGNPLDHDPIPETISVNVEHHYYRDQHRLRAYLMDAEDRSCATVGCRDVAVAMAQEWIGRLT